MEQSVKTITEGSVARGAGGGEGNSHKRRSNSKKQINRTTVFAYILFSIAIIIVMIPLYIAIITSLMSRAEANFAEFHWIPKQGVSFRGYVDAFTKEYGGTNIFQGLWNTLWIYVPSILVGLYFSAMAAFAFAKMKFRGKEVVFTILMTSMMIPGNMGTIAKILIYDGINWVGTPLPIMVPRMMGTIAMIFFLRQFYVSIPKDLLDAGRIDGLSYFGVFNRIMLPISIPALLVQFIFEFIAGYNDYNDPLFFLNSNPQLRTIQLTLAFMVDPYEQDWPLRLAACISAAIPMFLLYLFTQKIMIRGLDISASIKG